MKIIRKKQGIHQKVPPLLIVLSGPSGAGKDATITKMKELGYCFHYVITVTTRPKRPDEIDRVHYCFISDQQFQKMMQAKRLLEWAKVYNHYYGIPKVEIEKALNNRQDVIVKVDVQGASTLKRIVPDAVFIFLMPQSMENLTERLKQRNNHRSLADLKLRLDKAKEEMERLSLFDYCIVNPNNNLGLTASKIHAIITAEKCRVNPRIIKL
ncbi:guanylate kinase [Chloroflexota bacterium]